MKMTPTRSHLKTLWHRRLGGDDGPEACATGVLGCTPNRRLPAVRRVRSILGGLTVVVAVSTVIPACSPDQKAEPPSNTLVFDSTRQNVPFIFIRYYPGGMRPEIADRRGIVAAVWQDGTVIRARTEELTGQAYVRGKLGADGLAELRRTIESTRILTSEPGGQSAADAAIVDLTLRDESGLRIWSYPVRLAVDERIIAIKASLMSIELTEVESIDADLYKRIPGDWFK